MFRNMLQDESSGKNEPLITRIKKNPFYYIIVFLLLINISLIFISSGVWFVAAHQKLFIAADFTNSYTGFKMVFEGDGAKLYDLAVQTKYKQEIMGNIFFESG